jgi:hypothetical protein
MSLMIPRETIDALRKQIDVSLNNYGIDCILWIPTGESIGNYEIKDAYATDEDLSYTQYSTKVFINWKPNIHKLQKLGIHVEDQRPITAWFGKQAAPILGPNAGTMIDVTIKIHSYFSINIEYVPGNITDSDKFECIDVIIPEFHDSLIRQQFLITPKRTE